MDNNQTALDTVFHALADPTRRAVIQKLGRGSATVSELAKPFDMALPSFMKHIGVLEASGLIGSNKVGRVRTCKIKSKKLAAAETWMSEQRALWEGRMDRLAEYAVQWFGPDGFRIESQEIDIRAGGVWRFEMVAPDGTRYSNRMEFLRIEPPILLEAIHGTDVDNDPDSFRLLATFDEQDDGKTVVTLRQMHPTPERRATVIGFGAVEYGAQTLDKLANHVAVVLKTLPLKRNQNDHETK